MTDADKAEVKKMISDAIAKMHLEIRQEIVNAKKALLEEIEKDRKNNKLRSGK